MPAVRSVAQQAPVGRCCFARPPPAAEARKAPPDRIAPRPECARTANHQWHQHQATARSIILRHCEQSLFLLRFHGTSQRRCCWLPAPADRPPPPGCCCWWLPGGGQRRRRCRQHQHAPPPPPAHAAAGTPAPAPDPLPSTPPAREGLPAGAPAAAQASKLRVTPHRLPFFLTPSAPPASAPLRSAQPSPGSPRAPPTGGTCSCGEVGRRGGAMIARRCGGKCFPSRAQARLRATEGRGAARSPRSGRVGGGYGRAPPAERASRLGAKVGAQRVRCGCGCAHVEIRVVVDLPWVARPVYVDPLRAVPRRRL